MKNKTLMCRIAQVKQILYMSYVKKSQYLWMINNIYERLTFFGNFITLENKLWPMYLTFQPQQMWIQNTDRDVLWWVIKFECNIFQTSW